MDHLLQRFARLYPLSPTPRLFRAPGRVNLIGEHTDYNLGFVLPMAIDLACFLATAPNRDARLRVFSEQLHESHDWPLAEIPHAKPTGHWTDRVLGIAWELHRRGVPLDPQNILIDSTVPLGSGLSSSASLGVSLTLALGGPRPPRALAEIAFTAEREFVGVPCGIMDQFAAACGHHGAALLLDCRSRDYRAVSLPDSLAILTADTMVRHEHSTGAYRARVEECAAAARALGLTTLRDATLPDLDRLTGNLLKRARHVITENARVEQFVAASARADIPAMGRLAVDSHRSLRDDYEVSSPELDFLVDTALQVPGVFGARMTGGGFGGCTVNFLHPDAAPALESALTSAYRKAYHRTPRIHYCAASAGASEIIF